MKSKTKARWIIKLFNNVIINVSEGNTVSKDEVLIKRKLKKNKLFSNNDLQKLPNDIWQKINQESYGKLVNKGDIIFQTNSLFPVKIKANVDGLFLGIDEFGNLKFELNEEDDEEIKSPVNGKVVKIDDEKIILEFEAIEYHGQGLVEGKAWGEGNFSVVKNLTEINYQKNGQIILVSELDQVMLSKAEVVGVVAVLINNKEFDFDKIKTSLPVLALEQEEWNEITSLGELKREVLINSKSGRLLIVVE